MSEEILHNEQVLNTSCCGVTCDYVERFLNSVKLCKKNHRSDSKGCRGGGGGGGQPPPPPPAPPEPSDWLLSWLSTGLSIDGTPTERKNAIGLDLSNKDGSAQ